MFNGHPSSSPLGDHMSNAVIKTRAASPSIAFECEISSSTRVLMPSGVTIWRPRE